MRRTFFGFIRYFFGRLRDAYRYIAFRPSQKRGVYRNFRQAETAAPAAKLGYNHRELALAYGSELRPRPDSSDFPVLFHLQRILTRPCTVLDVGGNVGTDYLRY